MSVGTKMREVRKLLNEIKSIAKTQTREGKIEPPTPHIQSQPQASFKDAPEAERATDDFRRSYERLYADFVAKNFESIRQFIGERDKAYLKEFARVNNLSIDASRASKERVIEEVMKRLAERRAISKRVT